jgi:hypothetical protein
MEKCPQCKQRTLYYDYVLKVKRCADLNCSYCEKKLFSSGIPPEVLNKMAEEQKQNQKKQQKMKIGYCSVHGLVEIRNAEFCPYCGKKMEQKELPKEEVCKKLNHMIAVRVEEISESYAKTFIRVTYCRRCEKILESKFIARQMK